MDDGSNDRIRFAEFELDRAHRRLFREGKPVQLYAKAFDLLTLLIENNGTVVSKEQILDRIWPDQFVEEANLSVQVSALRKALGESKNEPRFIVTIPGVGYKFLADVESSEDDIVIEKRTLERIFIDEQLTEEHHSTPQQLPEAADNTRRWKPIAAALTVVLLAGIAGFLYLSFYAPPGRVSSVAVLPFLNSNASAEGEYLSEGLAESVIHALSGVPDLRVLSRNSSFRYRGEDVDARAIGRDLGVDAILTGRIIPTGDSLSIRAELVSTADNSVIWGEQFTRKLADAERLRSDIARSIADKLRLKLSSEKRDRLEREQTANPEAYRLYLLGQYHLNKFNDEGFFKARDHFQQAIEADPNYALAHAGLAEAYNRLCGYNVLASSDCFPKSRIAAERALELDEGLAEPHATLGSVKHFYDWDWPGAEKEYRRAIDIDPNGSSGHQLYSYYLTAMGRFDESLTEMRLAHELDPLSIEKSIGVAEIFYFQKRHDEAIAQANRTLEIDKNAGFVHWMIGNIYVDQGRFDEAIAKYEQAIPLSGDSPDEPASLAYVHALTGNHTEARRILAELKQRRTRQFISPCVLAIVHSGLGEKDQAFALLEEAYNGRDFMLTLLKIEPTYGRLRDDPRYADLMRRVGF